MKRPESSKGRNPNGNVSVVSKRRYSPIRQKGPKPPSTFGDSDSDYGDPSSPLRNKHNSQFRNVSKLDPSEQRRLAKKYLEDKLKEIKDKYKS